MAEFIPLALRIENLWVVKGGGLFSNRRAILQDVSFAVEPGQFIAVVGPNGAGKTTLLKALIGDKPASGRILLYKAGDEQADFEELYDNPEYWLQQIGYVPVDNVMHDNLTVRQALLHIGRLRLPEKIDADIETKMRAKLRSLGFSTDDERLDQLVSTLSSGERKKVNICAELLTDPALLLLDEPTSNLDPNAERDLMESLKNLTNGESVVRPTILIITHTLETLDRCDRVIFIANSRLEEDGDIEAVYARLEQKLVQVGKQPASSVHKFEHWATIFDHFKTADSVAKRESIVIPKPTTYASAPARTRTPDAFWRQFKILSSRYFLMRFNDLGGIFVTFVTGFVAGFLMLIAPSEIFLEADDASAARQTVVLYIILVIIMGAFISHREISKEFRIYLHERTKGLNPLAYVMSKMVWLAVVVGILSPLMILALTGTPIARVLALVAGIGALVIGLAALFARHSVIRRMSGFRRNWRIIQVCLLALPLVASAFVQLQNKQLPDYPLPAGLVEGYLIVTLVTVSIAAVTLGLLISAAVGSNNDRATQLIIAAIIFNVILAFSALVIASPAFRQFFDVLEPFTISHWGYRSFSSSLSIYCWAGQYRFENFNSYGQILASLLFVVAHLTVMVAFAVLALRMHETWTPRRRLAQSLLKEAGAYAVIALVICLVSWGFFLNQQSSRYFDLTFYDRLYGGTRYAHVETVANATQSQIAVGQVSQSQCGVS